jgi:hypothetical protein
MALVGAYYFWGVRAAGYGFDWHHDLGGYYNYLARGFASGHLYVPIQPSRELLAAPDPWDPYIEDRYRMQDMTLYGGRYYLYFGAAPAALLFLPWRIATHHDLPENFALFLFCFGGFLFYCAAFLGTLRLAGAAPRPALLALWLFALGVCQSVPFLLNRVWVYEVAIGGGYFFLAGAVYFLSRGVWPGAHRGWLAAAGLMSGLAVASRPDLVFAGAIAAAVLWRSKSGSRSRVLPFLYGFLPVLLAAAIYNYLRFENPLEFGFHYTLAGPGQNRIDLSYRNLLPGGFYFLFSPPNFHAVFPWLHLIIRRPFALPPDYVLEPLVGALWLAPFVPGTFFLVLRRRTGEVRDILRTTSISAVAILLFLTCTHLATQRYEVDFLPLAVFAALGAFATAPLRRIAAIVLTFLIALGAIVNLALAVSGPYDEMQKNRPRSFVRIAGLFSPIAAYRPALDPNVRLEFDFRPKPGGPRQTLIAIGQGPHSYTLAAEGRRLISQADDSTQTYDFPQSAAEPIHLRLVYTRAAGCIAVESGDRALLCHPVEALVTAPAQVVVIQ